MCARSRLPQQPVQPGEAKPAAETHQITRLTPVQAEDGVEPGCRLIMAAACYDVSGARVPWVWGPPGAWSTAWHSTWQDRATRPCDSTASSRCSDANVHVTSMLRQCEKSHHASSISRLGTRAIGGWRRRRGGITAGAVSGRRWCGARLRALAAMRHGSARARRRRVWDQHGYWFDMGGEEWDGGAATWMWEPTMGLLRRLCLTTVLVRQIWPRCINPDIITFHDGVALGRQTVS